jgi:hypothetical protein
MGAFEIVNEPINDRSHPHDPGKWPWNVVLHPLVLLDGRLAPQLRDFGLVAPHKYAGVKTPARRRGCSRRFTPRSQAGAGNDRRGRLRRQESTENTHGSIRTDGGMTSDARSTGTIRAAAHAPWRT